MYSNYVYYVMAYTCKKNTFFGKFNSAKNYILQEITAKITVVILTV